MHKIFLSFFLSFIIFSANSQDLSTTPNGGNKKAFVLEKVGLTDVSVSYDRPAVKGREGKIWGNLVHYGYKDLGYGTSKASPWRAGANENTVIEFSNAVKIEGKPIPAGKYGFFIDVEADHCVLIFNKRYTSWGSFFYDPSEDVLKVEVKPQVQDKSTEWLKYEFSGETENAAILSLVWEKWQIPFKIETDLVKDQMDIYRKELTSSKSSDWKNWNIAAKYALEHNVSLEEALLWNEKSITMPFVGQRNFSTLITRANLLDKLGKTTEAQTTQTDAYALATKEELFSYGVSLIKQNNIDKAFSVMKLNFDKNPGQYLPAMGMARTYSAMGNFNEAIKYAQQAKNLAKDPNTINTINDRIIKLQNHKDIN